MAFWHRQVCGNDVMVHGIDADTLITELSHCIQAFCYMPFRWWQMFAIIPPKLTLNLKISPCAEEEIPNYWKHHVQVSSFVSGVQSNFTCILVTGKYLFVFFVPPPGPCYSCRRQCTFSPWGGVWLCRAQRSGTAVCGGCCRNVRQLSHNGMRLNLQKRLRFWEWKGSILLGVFPGSGSGY